MYDSFIFFDGTTTEIIAVVEQVVNSFKTVEQTKCFG